MDIALVRSVESLLQPPGSVLLLGLVGLWWMRHHKRGGAALIGLALLLLYVASTPLMSGWLRQRLAEYPALSTARIEAAGAQAIVVLGGGRDSGADEYGGESVSSISLQRLRYGAWLQRKTGLPLLVAGGSPLGGTRPEAELMAAVLRDEFGVPVRWLETRSVNTFENAALSAPILKNAGIRRVFLVTSGYHMPRAVAAFDGTGIEVVAAPTVVAKRGALHPRAMDFIPMAWALQETVVYLHELAGRVWYYLYYD
jgi:uncharacterized SAM-binding protein YcdF (DUF218 family)